MSRRRPYRTPPRTFRSLSLAQFPEGVDGTAPGPFSILNDHAEVPSLVCLDLMLPESSGYEICEYIRSTPRLREVPVLVISGLLGSRA